MELSIENLEKIIAKAKSLGNKDIRVVFWDEENSDDKHDEDYHFSHISSVSLDSELDIKEMLNSTRNDIPNQQVLYIAIK
jgi:hypothetical protein